MPWLLRNLVDGETPSEAQYVQEGYSPAAGEMILSDAEYAQKREWVWDAQSNQLRQPTDADRLRWARPLKRREIRRAFIAAVKALFPEIVEDSPSPEMWIVELIFSIATNDTLIRDQLQQIVAKRRRGYTAIKNASDLATLNAITWENA